MVCISFWCLLVGFSNWFSMLLTDWQKQVETSLFVRCIETTNQLLDLQLPTSTLRASKPAIFWHVQQLKHHMEWCLRIQSIQIMDSQRACPNRSLMTHSPRFGLCESQCASTRLPTTGFWVKRSQMMCIYISLSLSPCTILPFPIQLHFHLNPTFNGIRWCFVQWQEWITWIPHVTIQASPAPSAPCSPPVARMLNFETPSWLQQVQDAGVCDCLFFEFCMCCFLLEKCRGQLPNADSKWWEHHFSLWTYYHIEHWICYLWQSHMLFGKRFRPMIGDDIDMCYSLLSCYKLFAMDASLFHVFDYIVELFRG